MPTDFAVDCLDTAGRPRCGDRCGPGAANRDPGATRGRHRQAGGPPQDTGRCRGAAETRRRSLAALVGSGGYRYAASGHRRHPLPYRLHLEDVCQPGGTAPAGAGAVEAGRARGDAGPGNRIRQSLGRYASAAPGTSAQSQQRLGRAALCGADRQWGRAAVHPRDTGAAPALACQPLGTGQPYCLQQHRAAAGRLYRREGLRCAQL